MAALRTRRLPMGLASGSTLLMTASCDSSICDDDEEDEGVEGEVEVEGDEEPP